MIDKTATPSARTQGELLFERYLRETGHSGGDDHEPDLGITTKPDYKISKNGASAVAEVKEFDDGQLHRRVTDATSNRPFATSDREQFGDVRNAIRDAARQLKPLEKSGIPLVVVITNPNNVFVPLGDFEVRAAIYGMPAVGGELDPKRGVIENMGWVPGRNGKLTASHLYVSAVAVLGTRTLLQDAHDVWIDGNSARLDVEFRDDRIGKAAAILEGLKEVTAPDGDYVFARVFRTESDDATPLASELFDGPHDVHHQLSRAPSE